eukprot:jgi/Psemu1/282477/fgenesh1_pg.8_\
MSTCLGTRVLYVERNKNSLLTATKRAVILVEVKDGYDQGLNIQLSTGSSAYISNISLSEVSCIFEDDPIDNQARVLELGRLFLREYVPDDGKQEAFGKNRTNNLTTTFQYEPAINDGCENNDDIVLVVQEKVVNGMTRTIYRTKMEKTDVISYCVSLGNTLNRSLREVEKLKNGVNQWKKTAQDITHIEQKNKNALFDNFTKLRNWMNEKHQSELHRLEETHKKEKLNWTAESIAPNVAPTKTKIPEYRKRIDLTDPINDSKELFGRENALALAEGRKLYPKSKNRTSVLRANDAVDMVGILKEGQVYERNRKGKQEEKRKPRQKIEMHSMRSHRNKDEIHNNNESKDRKEPTADDDEYDNEWKLSAKKQRKEIRTTVPNKADHISTSSDLSSNLR